MLHPSSSPALQQPIFKAFPDTVELKRPIPTQTREGEDDVVELHDLSGWRSHDHQTVLYYGKHKVDFFEPNEIPLNTTDKREILDLLWQAGCYYMSQDCDAAELGIKLFLAGRDFVLQSDHPWIGWDWDFTTTNYRIYGEVLPLISMKLFSTLASRFGWNERPPREGQMLYLLEAHKPAVVETMVGMMVGYAMKPDSLMKRGIEVFTDWERYADNPGVRIPTQTWDMRLAKLTNDFLRFPSLMLGRFPGKDEIDGQGIHASKTFITMDDFLPYADAQLNAFRNSDFCWQEFDSRQRDYLLETFQLGKAHSLKPIEAFTQLGWEEPTLIFDDSPISNTRLAKQGIAVVDTVNPLSPGRELKEAQAITVRGRKAGFKQMIQMSVLTEAGDLLAGFEQLTDGASRVRFSSHRRKPIPQGSVLVVNEIQRPLPVFYSEFEQKKLQRNRLIREIKEQAGGLRQLRATCQDASSRERTYL